MGCEICGRSSCTRSFHDLNEQQDFDNIADKIKDTMRDSLKSKINRLCGETINEAEYVMLDDVIRIINNY